MSIAFLQTADVHVATFDKTSKDLDSGAQPDHHVDASLLDRARKDDIDAVRADVETLLKKLSDADVVLCRDAWALFEAGDMEGCAASIESKVEAEPDVKSIVLAQASMRMAEDRLADTGIPVRSSPVIAAHRRLEMTRAKIGAKT